MTINSNNSNFIRWNGYQRDEEYQIESGTGEAKDKLQLCKITTSDHNTEKKTILLTLDINANDFLNKYKESGSMSLVGRVTNSLYAKFTGFPPASESTKDTSGKSVSLDAVEEKINRAIYEDVKATKAANKALRGSTQSDIGNPHEDFDSRRQALIEGNKRKNEDLKYRDRDRR